MNINTQLPAWAWWLMGLGLALFAGLVALSVRRNRGVKRTLFAAPYSLWMILFTVLPVILIGYYAFTDQSGAFTLDNFRNFWDSNYTKNQLYASLGPEAAQYMVRGTVNVDTLVYSLWMAFLCTIICLVLGYPAALFMADRKMKLGPSLVVLFIIPMWMNFLLRTLAWQSLLEREGVINGILGAIGLPPIEIINTPAAVILGMVYNFLPFMILPLYNCISKIDENTINAAYDLGANRIQTIARVIVPQSFAGIVSGITMVFVPALTTFVVSDILGGGKVMLIGNVIEQQFTVNYDWSTGAGLSIVLMLFVLISMMLVNSFDKSGEGRLL